MLLWLHRRNITVSYSHIWPSLLPNSLLTSKQAFLLCRNQSTRSVSRLLPQCKSVTIKFKAFFRLLHQRLIAFPTLGFAYSQERQLLVSHLLHQCVQSALQHRSTTQALLLSTCFCFLQKPLWTVIWKWTVNINFLCTLGTSEMSTWILHVMLCPCFSKQVLFCCSRAMYIMRGEKSLGWFTRLVTEEQQHTEKAKALWWKNSQLSIHYDS